MPLAKVSIFLLSFNIQLADNALSGWSQQQLRDIDHGRQARVGRMEPTAQLDVRCRIPAVSLPSQLTAESDTHH